MMVSNIKIYIMMIRVKIDANVIILFKQYKYVRDMKIVIIIIIKEISDQDTQGY